MTFPYTQATGRRTTRRSAHLGFRYLEIPGAGEAIDGRDVTAVVVHDRRTRPDGEATFTSSDATLDAVVDLMQRSALYSVQETFVDTPTREKGQFLGDAVNISYALMASQARAGRHAAGDPRVHADPGAVLDARATTSDATTPSTPTATASGTSPTTPRCSCRLGLALLPRDR